MIEISEKGPCISQENITILENKFHSKFSKSYCEFLLEFNGGQPEPDIIDIENHPESPTDIKVFFGFDRKFESSNIIWNLEQILELELDRQVLPIACDSGGNPFCLISRNGTADEVVYLDLSDNLLYPVAPNFLLFISLIRPWSD